MMRLRRLRCFLGKKGGFHRNCFQGQLKDITTEIIAFNIISEAVNAASKKGKKPKYSES